MLGSAASLVKKNKKVEAAMQGGRAFLQSGKDYFKRGKDFAKSKKDEAIDKILGRDEE